MVKQRLPLEGYTELALGVRGLARAFNAPSPHPPAAHFLHKGAKALIHPIKNLTLLKFPILAVLKFLAWNPLPAANCHSIYCLLRIFQLLQAKLR